MTRPSFDQAVDEVSIAPSWWMVMFRALTSHGVQKKHLENQSFVDRFLGKPWVFHILVLPRSIFRNMISALDGSGDGSGVSYFFFPQVIGQFLRHDG